MPFLPPSLPLRSRAGDPLANAAAAPATQPVAHRRAQDEPSRSPARPAFRKQRRPHESSTRHAQKRPVQENPRILKIAPQHRARLVLLGPHRARNARMHDRGPKGASAAAHAIASRIPRYNNENDMRDRDRNRDRDRDRDRSDTCAQSLGRMMAQQNRTRIAKWRLCESRIVEGPTSSGREQRHGLGPQGLVPEQLLDPFCEKYSDALYCTSFHFRYTIRDMLKCIQ